MVSLVGDEGRYFDESFSAILVKAFVLIPVYLVVENIFLLTYLAHCFAILYSAQIILDIVKILTVPAECAIIFSTWDLTSLFAVFLFRSTTWIASYF